MLSARALSTSRECRLALLSSSLVSVHVSGRGDAVKTVVIWWGVVRSLVYTMVNSIISLTPPCKVKMTSPVYVMMSSTRCGDIFTHLANSPRIRIRWELFQDKNGMRIPINVLTIRCQPMITKWTLCAILISYFKVYHKSQITIDTVVLNIEHVYSRQ